MGNKRTNWTNLPEGAIVVSIDISDEDSDAAEEVLGQMLISAGEQNFNLAMDHLYKLFAFDVLTNSESPLHAVFRQAMVRLSEHTMEHLHQSHLKIEALEEELRTLRGEVSSLRGRVNSLESALSAVRRCLKSPIAKNAIQHCQQHFRHRKPIGDTEVAASELAETVKSACVCIKDL